MNVSLTMIDAVFGGFIVGVAVGGLLFDMFVSRPSLRLIQTELREVTKMLFERRDEIGKCEDEIESYKAYIRTLEREKANG